jgi:hypothetical protein
LPRKNSIWKESEPPLEYRGIRNLLSNVVIDSCVKKSLSLPHTQPTLELHLHTTCEAHSNSFSIRGKYDELNFPLSSSGRLTDLKL